MYARGEEEHQQTNEKIQRLSLLANPAIAKRLCEKRKEQND